MRSFLLISVMLAATALAAPTEAQTKFVAPISQIFERVCLANRPDFDKAIPGLEAAGYVESSTTDESQAAIRKFETQIGETPWAVQIADRVRGEPGEAGTNRVRACSVIGSDPNDAGEAELAAWLGIPKAPAGKATGSLFVEKDGKRRLITASPADTVAARTDAGGFYFLSVVKTDAGKMAMLIHLSPAQ